MAWVMRCVGIVLFCSVGWDVVYGDLPGQFAMGFAQGSGYGAIFVHRQFARFFGFIGVDISFKIEADVDVLPEGRFFSCFPVTFYGHPEIIYFLSLFVENGDDIDAAAAA
jgi:hypothetical protein